MGIELIHHFTANTLWCYDTHLVRGQDRRDMLGVLSRVQLADAGEKSRWVAEFALIDIQKLRCEQVITYNCMGPGKQTLTEDALLRYDPFHMRWVIVQMQYYSYDVGVRTVKVNDDGSLILSPFCLLQQNADWGGMNPLLDLEVNADFYRLLSHQKSMDHLFAPRIWKTDVTIWDAWDQFLEQMATTRAGNVNGVDTWQEWLYAIEQQKSTPLRRVDRVFLPEQATIDPRTDNARQTSDVEIVSQEAIIETEMALTITDGATRLCAFCSPEIRPDADLSEEELATLPTPPAWYVKLPVPEDARLAPPQWRIWLSAWDRDALRYKWAYMPQIGLPFDENLPAGASPSWPAAYVAMLAGPTTSRQEPTFVAIVALSQLEENGFLFTEEKENSEEDTARDEEVDDNGVKSTEEGENDEEGEENEEEEVEIVWGKPYGPIQSCGVCLTHDGQIVQKIDGVFGLRPSLCRCGEMIVGVDQSIEGWQLWNWVATQEDRLRTILPLNPACRRAFVRAEAEAETFWLIEEMPEGVRVSKREATTLAIVTDGELLAGARLVLDPEASLSYSSRGRPLDPQRTPGLIPYGKALLLVVSSKQGEMDLYQVQ